MLRLLPLTCILLLLGWSDRLAGADFDQTHPAWNRLLASQVTNGLIRYAAIQSAPELLKGYLDEVAKVPEEQFKSWSRPNQLAFLINVYNAATVQLIVDHYPVTSIRKIGSVLKSPWKQDCVHLWGKVMTLDDLEHGIIRPQYTDPRVHFALVCAAKGCPPLRNEAYVGTQLNAQLDDQARQFLSDTHKNRMEAERRTVYLSPIFKWYSSDFEAKGGNVLSFIRPYWPKSTVAMLEAADSKVRYTEYDWTLNEQPAR